MVHAQSRRDIRAEVKAVSEDEVKSAMPRLETQSLEMTRTVSEDEVKASQVRFTTLPSDTSALHVAGGAGASSAANAKLASLPSEPSGIDAKPAERTGTGTNRKVRAAASKPEPAADAYASDDHDVDDVKIPVGKR